LPEFDALEAKLKHNEDYDYKYWKDKIRLLVEEAIIIDYYYSGDFCMFTTRRAIQGEYYPSRTIV
jgi:hypothetical protein